MKWTTEFEIWAIHLGGFFGRRRRPISVRIVRPGRPGRGRRGRRPLTINLRIIPGRLGGRQLGYKQMNFDCIRLTKSFKSSLRLASQSSSTAPGGHPEQRPVHLIDAVIM